MKRNTKSGLEDKMKINCDRFNDFQMTPVRLKLNGGGSAAESTAL